MHDRPERKYVVEDGRHLLLADTINHILFFLAIKMGGGDLRTLRVCPMPLAIYVVKT